MGDVLMEILKDRIDEKIRIAVEEAKAENQAKIEAWKAKNKEWEAKIKEWEAKNKEWEAKCRALEAENKKLMKENKETTAYIHNLVKGISMGAEKRNDPEKNSEG
ncbi:MAG: hypothetical protein IJ088_03480 [Clostridia bacterium]|nr:hypothetical protein [Clostridia bacterium]